MKMNCPTFGSSLENLSVLPVFAVQKNLPIIALLVYHSAQHPFLHRPCIRSRSSPPISLCKEIEPIRSLVPLLLRASLRVNRHRPDAGECNHTLLNCRRSLIIKNIRSRKITLLLIVSTFALSGVLLGAAISTRSAPVSGDLAGPRVLARAAPASSNLVVNPSQIYLPLIFEPPSAAPPTPADAGVRFAVIGDFGKDNADAAQVAALVNGWNPDFIITTGDNNYPDGEAATIDDHIGQHYSRYIGDYQGDYGPGSPTNRFWPSLGNHDWHSITCSGDVCSGPYFDYFTLPGNERYYEVDLGLLHLFAVDSDKLEPHGWEQDSIQAAWLQERLGASDSCYNLVYFHHPPYTTGQHGSKSHLQWPFADWGADAILNGHNHLYERLDVAGTPYFVNGAGGARLYDFDNMDDLPPEAASIVRYNQDHGAMLVTATPTFILYQFYNTAGDLIDHYIPLQESCPTRASSQAGSTTHAPTDNPATSPTITPASSRR